MSGLRLRAFALLCLIALPYTVSPLCVEQGPESAIACDHGPGPDSSTLTPVGLQPCDAALCTAPAAVRLSLPGIAPWVGETKVVLPLPKTGLTDLSTTPLTPPPRA